MRRSRSTRSVGAAGVAAAVVSALAFVFASPVGAAAPASDQTATASALQATLGTVTPTIQVTGPLAGLVGPIVNATLGALWSTIGSLPPTLITPLINALTQSNGGATTPTTNNAPFTATVPSPCNQPSCYSAANPSVNLGAASLGTGVLQGWTQYDDTGAKPEIRSTSVITNIGLGLLGINLLNLGAVTATTDCIKTGTSTASASVTNTQLLGGSAAGGIDLQLTGGALQIRFKNGSFQPLSVLASNPVNLSLGGGLSATASVGSGGYLQVAVHVGLNQLLGVLGLPAISATTATVDLTLSVGAVTPVSSPATVGQAWGLEVGLDLAADVGVDLVGASAHLLLPSGLSATSMGNLADLRFGYASCTAGSLLPPTATSWIPPELS